MSVKNFFGLILAVAAFGSFALGQEARPNQPRGTGFGRGERDFARGDDDRGFGQMRAGRIDFGRLNLTDAQKQQIQTLLENSRKSMDATRAQFEEMGNLMRLKREGLLTTEQGNRLTALQAQMKTNMDRMQNDILAVLTLVTQMQNERGGMKGMRDGDGGGMRQRREMPPAQRPAGNN